MKRSDLLKAIVVANLLVPQLANAESKPDIKQEQANEESQITELVDIDSSLIPQHNGVCSNGSC